VDEKWKAEIAKTLLSCPLRAVRLVKEYASRIRRAVLTVSKSLADQFEAAKTAKNPKRVANLVQGELMGRLKARADRESPISMQESRSADLVESGAISARCSRTSTISALNATRFPEVYDEEGRPQQSTDTSALEKISTKSSPRIQQLEQYRAGKKTMIVFRRQ